MGIQLSDIFLKVKLSKLLVSTNTLFEICSCDVISSLHWHKNGLQSHQWLFHVLLESVHAMQNIGWDLKNSFSDLINIFGLCRETLIDVKAPNFIIIHYLLIHQINPLNLNTLHYKVCCVYDLGSNFMVRLYSYWFEKVYKVLNIKTNLDEVSQIYTHYMRNEIEALLFC